MVGIKSIFKPLIPIEFLAFRRRLITNSYVKKETEIFKKAVFEYLAKNGLHKLQLGSQRNALTGWLNTDRYADKINNVFFLDVTKNFNIPNESFDYVYCEELIEHINYKEGMSMLSECFRILKPGGKIRIGTPDLKSFIGMYQSNQNQIQKDYMRWIVDNYLSGIKIYSSVFVINNVFYNWEHKFIYDFETLADSLQRIGFTNTIRKLEGESDDENLRNIEQHIKSSENNNFRNFESFFIEGQKPLK